MNNNPNYVPSQINSIVSNIGRKVIEMARIISGFVEDFRVRSCSMADRMRESREKTIRHELKGQKKRLGIKSWRTWKMQPDGITVRYCIDTLIS